MFEVVCSLKECVKLWCYREAMFLKAFHGQTVYFVQRRGVDKTCSSKGEGYWVLRPEGGCQSVG